jgi:hypothetical protein
MISFDTLALIVIALATAREAWIRRPRRAPLLRMSQDTSS